VAKTPAPTVAEATAAKPAVVASSDVEPAPAPPAAKPRYRIWPHGGLWNDNVFFAPGEELPLNESEIATLIATVGPVVERIEE
jgi:hypothetical protein